MWKGAVVGKSVWEGLRTVRRQDEHFVRRICLRKARSPNLQSECGICRYGPQGWRVVASCETQEVGRGQIRKSLVDR